MYLMTQKDLWWYKIVGFVSGVEVEVLPGHQAKIWIKLSFM